VVHTPMEGGAAERVGVVHEHALDMLEVEQAWTIHELIEHPRGDRIVRVGALKQGEGCLVRTQWGKGAPAWASLFQGSRIPAAVSRAGEEQEVELLEKVAQRGAWLRPGGGLSFASAGGSPQAWRHRQF